jgi:hypothetical protein
MSSRLSLAMSASALVVALLGVTQVGHALVSALPRNSVGPLQLKRNAVGPQKIAPNAVRAGHVLNGSLLADDFKAGQIPAGPPGPAGPAGPAGAPGVSQKQIVTAETASDSSSPKQITTSCPAGKQVIGGGANITGVGGPALFASHPATTTSWFSFAYEVNATGGAWRLKNYVICAKVS